MLLDETMAHSCISETITGMTVDMQARYLKPVDVGEQIRVVGEVTRLKSRIIETQARINNAAGDIVAKGNARFLKT
jgi:acyl-coenzyme A thioesterase PaaI-like protein